MVKKGTSVKKKIVEKPKVEKFESKLPAMFANRKSIYQKTGKRKTAHARVWLALGKGELTINDKPVFDYFKDLPFAEKRVEELFGLTGHQRADFNISVKLSGSGRSSQLDALLHGIAQTLESLDSKFRPVLKRAGHLTRDSRMKERRKYGLAKARKKKQFSKR